MSTQSIRSTAPRAWTWTLRLWAEKPPLVTFAIAMMALASLFAVGLLADGRTVTGQPAWLKPLKFALSMAIYSATVAWMLGFVRSERRWVRTGVWTIRWAVIVVFAVELAAIVLQAARGVPSHFNVATPFDTFVWSTMGTAITVLWALNFVLAALLFARRFERPALGWGLRLGVLLGTVGMAQAFLMTSPTAQQLAGWTEGRPVHAVGAHSVGAPDGTGEALPGLGWRTETGDLRVGHFVGIHGLQVVPLFAWFLTRRRRLDDPAETGLVAVAAASYLSVVALLTWQALRGQALIAPDAWTLAALAGIVAVTALASGAIVWTSRRRLARRWGAARTSAIGRAGSRHRA